MSETALNVEHDLTKPADILTHCSCLNPIDKEYQQHPIIVHFGSPSQPIYVDHCYVHINGIKYDSPLILPIYDGQMELVQCAVLQDSQRVQVMPDGLARGFACYGEFSRIQPVIITYSLEAFFKIAQTGYAVALVPLPALCNTSPTELKAFDFEQMAFVIHQLVRAGYTQLYMPVRPEHIQQQSFQSLEKNTAVRLLNQYQKADQSEFLTNIYKDDDAEEVQEFIQFAIGFIWCDKTVAMPSAPIYTPKTLFYWVVLNVIDKYIFLVGLAWRHG